MIVNALKHAFPATAHVIVRRASAESVLVCVGDDGIGLPAAADLSNPKSLGLLLVRTLTRQIDGRLQVTKGVGTRIEIEFPA